MNTPTQNAASNLASYPFDNGIDQKLDHLKPKFEHTLRELVRLYMDWSGEVPDGCRVYRERRDLLSC